MTDDERTRTTATLYDFATWAPLLATLRAGQEEAPPGGCVAGRIGPRGWSLPGGPQCAPQEWARRQQEAQARGEAVQQLLPALAEAGLASVAFTAEVTPDGRAVLRLYDTGPAVEAGLDVYPGALLLVEGAVPEPWRRLPETFAGAGAAARADPALLERTLRERIPDAVGATEAEIAAAEERLGLPLPEELKALYRVTRARREDWAEDREAVMRVVMAVGVDLLPLDELSVADAASRASLWPTAAMEAVTTSPGAAVQDLVGSPGWIHFGGDGGGGRIAIDLTPGPGGHVGQVISIPHDERTGAALVADSLTGLVVDGWRSSLRAGGGYDGPPLVAHVNVQRLTGVEEAAHERLEALSIGVREGEPLSLAPVIGLPRLRTLKAHPGTLADPLEIARLTGLEFLELGPEDWRALLDAEAVPRGLAAAAIGVREPTHPGRIVELANEILALWERPVITEAVIEGRLP